MFLLPRRGKPSPWAAAGLGAGGASFPPLEGFLAIGPPLFFSAVIAQFVGAIALFVALFGKEVTHRALEALFALIRIAAGFALFVCVASSIAVITMIFAVFLIVAGFSSSDSASVLDLFFGINLRDVSPHAPLGCTEERGRLTLTTEAFRRSFRKKATSSFGVSSLRQI
jgi:hypothetical protein